MAMMFQSSLPGTQVLRHELFGSFGGTLINCSLFITDRVDLGTDRKTCSRLNEGLPNQLISLLNSITKEV